MHGDFHIRNVMIDPAAASVKAVLDWELSTLGDPLADIGSTLAYWPSVGGPQLSAAPVELLDGFPDQATLAADYVERTGRDPRHLGTGMRRPVEGGDHCPGHSQTRRTTSRTGRGRVPTHTVVDSMLDMALSVADDAGI